MNPKTKIKKLHLKRETIRNFRPEEGVQNLGTPDMRVIAGGTAWACATASLTAYDQIKAVCKDVGEVVETVSKGVIVVSRAYFGFLGNLYPKASQDPEGPQCNHSQFGGTPGW